MTGLRSVAPGEVRSDCWGHGDLLLVVLNRSCCYLCSGCRCLI